MTNLSSNAWTAFPHDPNNGDFPTLSTLRADGQSGVTLAFCNDNGDFYVQAIRFDAAGLSAGVQTACRTVGLSDGLADERNWSAAATSALSLLCEDEPFRPGDLAPLYSYDVARLLGLGQRIR